MRRVHVPRARLRGRGTESEEQGLMRLKKANEEMEFGKTPGNFDVNIVNNDDTMIARAIIRQHLASHIFVLAEL